MELFSLYADGDRIRALFLAHLSDFTTDHSLDQDQVDQSFLERCVMTPKMSAISFPEARTFSASRSAACPRSANSSRRAVRCGPSGRST
jgi:hypothetical protein